MAEVKFILQGKEVTPPSNWIDLKVIGEWINGSVQPQLVTTPFKWEREAAEMIQAHIEAGKIFEAMELIIQVSDEGTYTIFNGFVDTTTEFQVFRENRVEARAFRPEDLDELNVKLKAFSYAYLLEKGKITKKDYTEIHYIVEPDENATDILLLLVTSALFVKEAAEATKESGEQIARQIRALASITAPQQIIEAIVLIILHAAYMLAMLIMFLQLMVRIKRALLPTSKLAYTMTLRKMLDIAVGHLGLTLKTNITELDDYVYLPSRNPLDMEIDIMTGLTHPKQTWQKLRDYRKKAGIPQVGDFGYTGAEAMQLVLRLFDAQLRVKDGEVELFSDSDNYWRSQSTYVLPDVLMEKFKYNTEEAFSLQLFSFETDTQDVYTIDDFRGTNFQVDLTQPSAPSYPKNLLKGYNEVRFPVALGSRRETITAVEKVFRSVAEAFLKMLKKMGAGNKAQNIISTSEHTGYLRVSKRYWGVPKLLYIRRGIIPAESRNKLSAKYLYEKFYKPRSFASPFTGQRIQYTGIKIPFTLADYLEISSNAFFTTSDGRVGKFTGLSWHMASNTAVTDFYIEKAYARDLVESTFEP